MKMDNSDYMDNYHCPKCGNTIKSEDNICNKCNYDSSEILELIEKGNLLCNLEKYPDAIECYDKVIKKGPHSSEAWCGKGDVFLKQGENSESKKSCNNCPLCPILSEVFYTDALKCYEKAIKIKSKDFYALRQKGIVLEKLGKYSEAKKYYELSKEINIKE